MKSYRFDFINGYKKTGKPVIIRRTIKADSMTEAERKLRAKYPRACFVGLVR